MFLMCAGAIGVEQQITCSVSAFQAITPDSHSPVQQFGNEGHNTVQGPGYVNWDFSAFKNIRLTESKELQLRGEFFNLLNHTNFRLTVSDIESRAGALVLSNGQPTGDPDGAEVSVLTERCANEAAG